ncbi:MAG TPA: hypothetical protein DIU15_05095 [Deltaproteobacteria bacterium]|nr:hypothetical protein [Deltaproteobacteria bacterium]HCP45393.1 hypothetical protein [Deltaproteobacteria bacterium]
MKPNTPISVSALPAYLATLVLAAAFSLPSTALACGGFFCQAQPVEQNAERILFEVNGDGTITATVEVRYSGDPADFSWVVPVPDTPTLDVVPQSTLTTLDIATVPQIISPPTRCTRPPPLLLPFVGMAEPEQFLQNDAGVDVSDLPSVGPYDDIQVVSSDDPSALTTWLADNGYLITSEMEPFIANYVEQDYKFLGMKLAPQAGISDIAPISMTFAIDQPMVPLVLTSVAAEPEMGVLIFVAANERYEADNFQNLVIDRADVQMNPRTRQNNYYPLSSWMIDEAGGQAFITELAQPSENITDAISSLFLATPDATEVEAYLQLVLARRPYVTRLFTRVSGWEMLTDPTFRPSEGGDISRFIDLSDRPEVEICASDPIADIRQPCGDTYCGVGALCATTDTGMDGCVCPSGTVARSISAPAGLGQPTTRTVTCQLEEFDMLVSAREDGTAPQDPCLNASCGDNGQCVDVGGFATCDCDDNYAAVTDSLGQLTCEKAVRTFDSSQLLWTEANGCSCSTSGTAQSLSRGAIVALALLPLAALRRRQG